MDLEKNRIWIFGDSFCTESDSPKRWTQHLLDYFGKKYSFKFQNHYCNYSGASMDTQTIIENWIKVLPFMDANDVMVVCLSDSSRARYPFKDGNEYTLPFLRNRNIEPTFNAYFEYAPVGYDPTDINTPQNFNKLDIPFSNTNDFKNHVRMDNAILSTKNNDKNKVELVESLYKITPCNKKFIYNWVDGDNLKSECIHSKDWVTHNIFNGVWDTLQDDWVRTNGEVGKQYDIHLSERCEKLMADYFIKEFEL